MTRSCCPPHRYQTATRRAARATDVLVGLVSGWVVAAVIVITVALSGPSSAYRAWLILTALTMIALVLWAVRTGDVHLAKIALQADGWKTGTAFQRFHDDGSPADLHLELDDDPGDRP